MRKIQSSKTWRLLLEDEQGQGLVEYVLALAMAISIASIIATGFRRSMFRMWEMMARDISAACPGCPADPSVRLR